MKRCNKCGEVKPLDEFHRASARARTRDGRQPSCKACTTIARRAWMAKNPDRVRGYREGYKRPRPEDPAKRAERWRRYYNENREKILVNAAHHSLKRRGIAEALTSEDREYIALLYRDPCAYCGTAAEQIDHIVPLHDGGSSEWGNLTASCRSCNASKQTASLLKFLLRAA